jgi:hypothetical protein
MKRLLIIVILIVSIIFISGCTSDEQANSEISTSSQSNQESDAQTSNLIIKSSDVPGLSLVDYGFFAVPKSTPDFHTDFHPNLGEGYGDDWKLDDLDENYLSGLAMSVIFMSSHPKYDDMQGYDDVLPLSARNIGQQSIWKDESGREVSVNLMKFDSSDNFYENYAKFWDILVDVANKNPPKPDDTSWTNPSVLILSKVDVNIGDYSYYTSSQNKDNPDIQETNLVLLYKNNWVDIKVIDETDESINRAIKIAKNVKSRLN